MKNKKQHFLPQCYLRNWSADQRSILTYNKDISKHFSQSLKSAGQQQNLYKVPDKYLASENADRGANFIETHFWGGYIEPMYGLLLSKIQQRVSEWKMGKWNNEVLDLAEKQDFASLIGLQYLRMPHIGTKYWHAMKSSADKRFDLIKRWSATIDGLDISALDAVRLKIDEDAKSVIHSTIFSDQQIVDDFQDAILEKHWIFYVSYSMGFFSSDRPIIVKPHLENQPNLLEGLRMPGVEIQFPLSPAVMLTLWDKEHFNFQGMEENHFVTLPVQEVTKYNIQQYCSAEKEVYSLLPQDLELIEKIKTLNGGKEFR